MNLEVLNGYVLAGIALFGICLYVAVIVNGIASLMSRTSTLGRKRSKNQNATARGRAQEDRRSLSSAFRCNNGVMDANAAGQPRKLDGRTKTMKYPVHIHKKVALMTVMLVITTGLLESSCSRGQATSATAPKNSGADSSPSKGEATLDLSPSQLNSIKIAPVGSYLFPVEKEAVGNISFADDLSVQVFPPYQGTIIKAFVELGDQVQKGQPLYTIKSPDLIQAESTLIGAAATFELTSKELARAKDLNGTNGVSERELEQAVSDQQTAEGALKAARDAVRVFGQDGRRNRPNDRFAQDRPSCWSCAARFPARSRHLTRRPGSWCSREMRRRPIRSRMSRSNGCWRMSPESESSVFSTRTTGRKSK